MKKIWVCLAVICAMLCSAALAENVYVTISNGQGEIVLVNAEVEVTDWDDDGVLSLADALYCAHEANYEAGAEGFIAVNTDYGLSLTRLWGEENGGSYGYYLNNASANSLSDAVKDGDSVYAFAYTDLVSWSDTYCYFDQSRIACAAGESFELVLTMQGYDADWNIVHQPVADAVITVNGEESGICTDADGKAVLSLDGAGEYVISAVSENTTLVPPVCVAAIG